jgi:hypothetical protein
MIEAQPSPDENRVLKPCGIVRWGLSVAPSLGSEPNRYFLASSEGKSCTD